MEVGVWIALGGLAANLAVAAVAVWTIRSEKNKTAAEHRKAEALEALAKSQATIAGSLERELASLRKTVTELQAQGTAAGQMAAVRIQELEHKRRDAEWKRSKELAKGLGWILENF